VGSTTQDQWAVSWPSVGRNRGHQRAVSWPPMGSFSWPRTAVLIDLALLTGLDQAGAGAITVAARCSPDTPITLIDPRGRDRALLEETRQPIAYGLQAALAPHCLMA